jgi:cytochrome c peroxidase
MIAAAAVSWLATVSSASQATTAVVRFDAKKIAKILTHSPLAGPPPDPTNAHADDPNAARLGQFLFFDKRLSSNGEIACATCHDPAKSFADERTLSQGLATGKRHVPSLLNVGWQRWMTWDGRADSPWAQASRPIESPTEMGSDRTRLAKLVAGDRELREAYERVFGMSVDPSATDRILAQTGKALEAYERKLVSADSEFDRFAAALRSGDEAAQAKYPEAAKRGLALFIGKANCRLCHAGPLFSDGEFHNIGVPTLDKSPPRDAGRYEGIEEVRRDPFNAAGAQSDDPKGPRAAELAALARTSDLWGEFRTPTLRNVARTAPYMHQGQFATLRDVLHYYSTLEGTVPAGHHGEQVIKPLHLSDGEIDDLLAFLESLNGAEVSAGLRSQPASPRAP